MCGWVAAGSTGGLPGAAWEAGRLGNIMEAPSLDVPALSGMVGILQERISEQFPEQIVVSELVGIPREQISEHIPKPIVVSELVDIPQEQISERILEQFAVSELVGIPQERNPEPILEKFAVSELVGIPQERNPEPIPEQFVDPGLVGIPQEQNSERISQSIAVPGLGVVDMNDPHAAEEALQIFRQVVVRRQAELVEEDVDEEEHEEESEEEVYVPVSRFLPVGSLCGCAGGSWLGELGSARTVRGARSLIIGVNCTPGRVSQGHTDPGVRG